MIELMIVLAIVAILATIAAPSLKQLIQSTTISSNVNIFMADMRYARSESIRRGGGVVMCRSDAPEAIDASCGTGLGPGSNGWVSGWIIFHDTLNDGARSYNADPLLDETILRVQSPITSINSILERGSIDSSTKFQFTATGRLLILNSAPTLQFGGSPLFANDVQRVVCVNVGGRARIAGNGATSCGSTN